MNDQQYNSARILKTEGASAWGRANQSGGWETANRELGIKGLMRILNNSGFVASQEGEQRQQHGRSTGLTQQVGHWHKTSGRPG
jgi:hypothetical protein